MFDRLYLHNYDNEVNMCNFPMLICTGVLLYLCYTSLAPSMAAMRNTSLRETRWQNLKAGEDRLIKAIEEIG